MITFLEAKNSRLVQVSQSCKNSDDFASLLNEATQRLMSRGDWPGVLVPIHICVQNGCVVWPKYIGNVRRINQCGEQVQMSNLWYDFVSASRYSNWRTSYGWGNVGQNNGFRLDSQGRSATYRDITHGEDRKVRAYIQYSQDIGKTIKLFGLDNNGQPLRERDNNNAWVDGITLTLAAPYVETTGYVRQIDRVIKETTQGNVRLYEVDPTTSLLIDLANYDPGETNPSYEKDKIFLGCGCCTTSSIVALVKLKFIPVRVDTDLVLIDNIPALKAAIQAIKLEEAGDRQGAREAMADAVHELNLQLDDEQPRDQIPVDTGFAGGSYVGSQRMI